MKEKEIQAANDGNSGAADDKSQLFKCLQIKIEGNKEKTRALKPFKLEEEEEEQQLPLIYRVPDVFHKMNEHAYTPSVVAIGPLHRGKKHLQAMEGVKLSYIDFLFHRTGNYEKTLRDCVNAMLNKASDARRYYADDFRLDEYDEQTQDDCVDAMLKKESLGRRYYAGDFRLHEDFKPTAKETLAETERFAKMMLIDGCFMIELFYRNYLKESDAVVVNYLKQTAVEHDLLVLENQLPYVVLQELFKNSVGQIPGYCNFRRPLLIECVLLFFRDVLNLEGGKLGKKDGGKLQKIDKSRTGHILHLLHQWYYLPAPKETKEPGSDKEEKEEEPRSDEKEKMKVIKNFKYSATELDLGGIKFRQGNKEDRLDVKFIPSYYYCFFCRRGDFKIPPLMVNDYTNLIFRNFIAFEQSCPLLVNPYFTSHAFLMDRLIDTAEDVKLLEKAEIICNMMGSRQEVASLFNILCKNVPIHRLYSTKACLEVIDFHKQRWPKFQVKLRRDYFSNPWAMISVGAAFVLFLLTLLQTIFTIRSYKHS